MSDFVNGLQNASDYINRTTIELPTSVTADLNSGTIAATTTGFSLKELICSLLADGYGISISGIINKCGMLHPDVRKRRVLHDLNNGGNSYIPPRVWLAFKPDLEYINTINKENFSDLKDIRPDLFEE